MTDVVYYVAMSLDGFIASEDGGVDWLTPFDDPDEDYGYAEFYGGIDALVMGRATYDQVLTFGAWPYPDKPCRVFARGGGAETPDEVEMSAAPPKDQLDALVRQGARKIWLVGGGGLAGSFLRDGLLDEIIVSIMPTLLGRGVPLFSGWPSSTPDAEIFHLESSRSYSSGVVQNHYTRSSARSPE